MNDLQHCNQYYLSLAQMGVGEGKQIGQWFGPNTVAQVIKYAVFFILYSLLWKLVDLFHYIF